MCRYRPRICTCAQPEAGKVGGSEASSVLTVHIVKFNASFSFKSCRKVMKLEVCFHIVALKPKLRFEARPLSAANQVFQSTQLYVFRGWPIREMRSRSLDFESVTAIVRRKTSLSFFVSYVVRFRDFIVRKEFTRAPFPVKPKYLAG
jgi:hypothetical protein